MLRRARGFVPDAITLPAGFSSVPSILATGADEEYLLSGAR